MINFKVIGLFLLMFAPSLSLFAGLGSDKGKSKAKGKPNVLVIYTDDHRFTGVHSLGGMQVITPNIDELATRGVAFTSAYLMGAFSGATCVPSRAMLLSGRPVFALDGTGHSIPEQHTTMGEAFGQAGYLTHIIGKWHQDRNSLARSFESGGPMMGLGTYLVDHYRMPLWDWNAEGSYTRENAYLLQYENNGAVLRRSLEETDKRGPTGTEHTGPHTSEIFADSAVEFFSSYQGKNPFFLYLAFHAPHDPRQAPEEYKILYPEEEIKLPPSYMPQHPFDNGHMVLRDEELAPWPRTPEIARKELSDYYAIITHLDAQIGKVMKALEQSGLAENTIIILAGDSGLGVGCHGLLGKQNIYSEDGIHIPLIMAGPGLDDAGRKIDALCYTHDIFPTICDLAGISTPESVEGISLLPVLENWALETRDYTYHAYLQFQRAYRKGDYKLIEYVRAPADEKEFGTVIRGSRVSQLFNLTEDPWETFNLAVFPEYRGLLDSLKLEMKDVAIREGDNKEAVAQDYDFWDYYE